MSTVGLFGLALGKHCSHLHGQDEKVRLVFRKKKASRCRPAPLCTFECPDASCNA